VWIILKAASGTCQSLRGQGQHTVGGRLRCSCLGAVRPVLDLPAIAPTLRIGEGVVGGIWRRDDGHETQSQQAASTEVLHVLATFWLALVGGCGRSIAGYVDPNTGLPGGYDDACFDFKPDGGLYAKAVRSHNWAPFYACQRAMAAKVRGKISQDGTNSKPKPLALRGAGGSRTAAIPPKNDSIFKEQTKPPTTKLKPLPLPGAGASPTAANTSVTKEQTKPSTTKPKLVALPEAGARNGENVNGGQDRYRMRRRVSRLPGLTVGVVTDLV
jgi:hypothetical protein